MWRASALLDGCDYRPTLGQCSGEGKRGTVWNHSPMPEPHAIPCGVAVLDTAVALESFDFSPARRWHAVVLDHGTPVLQLETWSPGALDSPGLARLLFLDHARYAAWRTALIGELEQRLGAHPPLSPPHLSRSVVVCTHR